MVHRWRLLFRANAKLGLGCAFPGPGFLAALYPFHFQCGTGGFSGIVIRRGNYNESDTEKI